MAISPQKPPRPQRTRAAPKSGDEEQSARFSRRIDLIQTGIAFLSLTASVAIAIGLYMYDSRVDQRQEISEKVDRTLAMYHAFVSDREVDELLKFTSLSALSSDVERLRIRNARLDPENAAFVPVSTNLEIHQTANRVLFENHLPLESFFAFNTHMVSLNKCVFGKSSDDELITDVTWRGDNEPPDFMVNVEKLHQWIAGNEKPESMCDPMTTFNLFGEVVKNIFFTNRGVFYCSGVYDYKGFERSQVELFLTFILAMEEGIRPGDKISAPPKPRTYLDRGSRSADCQKDKWTEWQDEMPGIVSAMLARRRKQLEKSYFPESAEDVTISASAPVEQTVSANTHDNTAPDTKTRQPLRR